MIQFEVRPWMTNLEDGAGVGNIFYGKDGYMVIEGYSSYKTFLGPKREPGPSRYEGGEMGLHFANFLDAVKSRDASSLHGPVETAHTSSALAHMGNTAYRLGRKLTFDPKTETYVGDDEANQMLTRDYRGPFSVPTVV